MTAREFHLWNFRGCFPTMTQPSNGSSRTDGKTELNAQSADPRTFKPSLGKRTSQLPTGAGTLKNYCKNQ